MAYTRDYDSRAAARLAGKLADALDWLISFPGIGRPGRVADTRELLAAGTNYIVVYRVIDDLVEVLAVLHTSQQWPSSFDPEL